MTLKATLIASTRIHRPNIAEQTPYQLRSAFLDSEVAADELAEFSARSVHGTWNRPNPNLEKNADYLRHLLDTDERSHFEHASATFWVTGASMALSVELRPFLPYLRVTERSLRYQSLDVIEHVAPAALEFEDETRFDLEDKCDDAKDTAIAVEAMLRRYGYRGTQARDAAIAFLPMATETTFVVTADLRTWRFVIFKSLAPDTSAEFFELGTQTLTQLRTLVAPNTFADIQPIRTGRPNAEAAGPLEEYAECG